MSGDDPLYEKLINMWDKREYMLELLSQNKARPLHLEAQSNAADIVMKIYNETGGDRERTLHLFEKALENYAQSMKLGGSKTLPELFNAAELEFSFDPETVRHLIDAVQEKLADLPA